MMPATLTVVFHALRSLEVSDCNCVDSRLENRTQDLRSCNCSATSKNWNRRGALNSGNAPAGIRRLLLLVAKICARESPPTEPTGALFSIQCPFHSRCSRLTVQQHMLTLNFGGTFTLCKANVQLSHLMPALFPADGPV
ncbi:hypothetical protein CABS01_02154 [Colletotrichum abscissum]|uniref:uncharacterized protein n=1 Tax=Colletotrichum abscissum TaxID=1671311 RepID=UPI0027D50735|nr:uncharacterized protein CABS01_02154 [Colletotrichum abscissum]KAK1488524.1 hypothetical protein CABS01_02154 [Colletotrichum abscissum]